MCLAAASESISLSEKKDKQYQLHVTHKVLNKMANIQ